MTPSKRLFDLTLSLLLALLLAPVLGLLVIVLLLAEGRPVFYISERMRTPGESFGLIKLRTMRPAPPGVKDGVTGGDKAGRMSRLQRLLRRTRADEIPQLWNVIRGDMSLVGPRPPLRLYVEDYPEIYGQVLQSRPGITGLASLRYHAVEERLLARCRTAEETDALYRRRCIPRKAALDLVYQRHRTLCWDLMLVLQTAARPFRHRG
jgi:lipopolysaccharide/colanic/teichoic acid biosynthesis glycosyltransferase